MKVSVIVTVYNLENYIEETLQSVFNQTYEDLEVIVVDDCSTDNSENIIKKFKDTIHYIKPDKNGGVLLATCEGLKAATGDIITFLDGDDTWDTNKVKEIIDLYKSDDNYVLVSHDYEYINENGQKIYPSDNTQEILQKLSNENNVDKINEVMKEGIKIPQGRVWLGSAFSINTKNFHVKNFLNWVDTLPEPNLVYQDWPLATFVMASNDGRFGYVNKKLFQYRLHESNHSGGSKMSIERAKKVAKKGLFTSNAILEILKKYSSNFTKEDFDIIENNRKMMIKEYEFLLALYNKKTIEAYKLFVELKKFHWTKDKAFKNLVRLISFSIFGSMVFEFKYLYYNVKKQCAE